MVRDEEYLTARNRSDIGLAPNPIAALAASSRVADDVIRELAEALRGHLDDDECSFDHNGCCQAHGDFSIGKYGEARACYMVRDRALLARVERLGIGGRS